MCTVFDPGLLSPPLSQLDVGDDFANPFISPPPEDTLRFGGNGRGECLVFSPSYATPLKKKVTKRKRLLGSVPSLDSCHSQEKGLPELQPSAETCLATSQTTPNPKPRKHRKHQGRKSSSQFTASPSTAGQFKDSVATINGESHAVSSNGILFESSRGKNQTTSSSALKFKSHSARRRSATPIAPYEYPRERFTPPREVFVTPLPAQVRSASNTCRRKSTANIPKLAIKMEPPVLDLTLPLPPPSPTDDPLLLTGPPSRQRATAAVKDSRKNHFRAARTNIEVKRNHPSMSSPSLRDSAIPPSRTGRSKDWSFSDYNIPPPILDLRASAGSDEDWTDSEVECASDTYQCGDCTGDFVTMSVPIKADLDSSMSGTRYSPTHWVRPGSPHPRAREGPILPTGFSKIGEIETDGSANIELYTGTNHFQGQAKSTAFGRKLHHRGPNLLSHANSTIAKHSSRAAAFSDVFNDEEDLSMGDSVERHCTPTFDQMDMSLPACTEIEIASAVPGDQDVVIVANDGISTRNRLNPVNGEAKNENPRNQFVAIRTREQTTFPNPSHVLDDILAAQQADHNQHSNSFDNTASTQTNCSHSLTIFSNPDDGFFLGSQSFPRAEIKYENEAVSMDEYREDSRVGAGLIQVSSDDPRAAARAAAILKQHDYDCFADVSTHHDTPPTQARFDSTSREEKPGICTSATTSVVDSHKQEQVTSTLPIFEAYLSRPSSPAVSLPELLKEAEMSLLESTRPSRVGSPLKTPSPFPDNVLNTVLNRLQSPLKSKAIYVPKEWTREDWKKLDDCFTEERLETGRRSSFGETSLADVEDIAVQNVVARFIRVIGGSQVLSALGPGWSYESLQTRARALQKRQSRCSIAPSSPGQHRRYESLIRDVSEFVHPSSPTRLRHSPAMPSLPRNDSTTEISVYPAIPPDNDSEPASHAGISARSIETFIPESYLARSAMTISKLTGPLSADSTIQVGDRRPGLPLPPRELLEKQRGPIATPARPPLTKPIPPKELVHLHPAPQVKPSAIPRPRQPQHLVKLRAVRPQTKSTPLLISRPRRSSGESVKDLIQTFEKQRTQQRPALLHNPRKTGGSALDMNRQNHVVSRPVWKI